MVDVNIIQQKRCECNNLNKRKHIVPLQAGFELTVTAQQLKGNPVSLPGSIIAPFATTISHLNGTPLHESYSTEA